MLLELLRLIVCLPRVLLIIASMKLLPFVFLAVYSMGVNIINYGSIVL